MSAVPPSAPHNVNNNSAHLKRVGQPKIKKEKKQKPGVPETHRQWKAAELALRSTMKTERKREAVLLIAAFRISSMCVCFCFSFSFCALHNEQQAKLLKKAK